MAKFVFLLSALCCAFYFVNSNLLDNEFTKIGDDIQSFSGLEPTIFRAFASRENKVEDINMRFYTGHTVKEHVDIPLMQTTDLIRQPMFKKDQLTVFYIHGYKETAEQESVHTVVEAYLMAQPSTNIVLIDWSNMAQGSYNINAAPNTRKVANAVAQQIKKLIDQGLALNKIHIVGHSLGGQTAGFIGMEMQKLGVTLWRISALDPAFPMFYPGLVLGRISKKDAVFVDVIHTDAGFYGAPVETGTVDFWPNKGRRYQPGCPEGLHLPMSPEDLCNHWRSWRFWAESIKNPNIFMATKGAGDTNVVFMGVAAQPGVTGDYYLTTNAASPFGKGENGIVH